MGDSPDLLQRYLERGLHHDVVKCPVVQQIGALGVARLLIIIVPLGHQLMLHLVNF